MNNGTGGKIKAKFTLGCMYELGEGGLPQNLETALLNFSYAANRMHQGAQWKMGILRVRHQYRSFRREDCLLFQTGSA